MPLVAITPDQAETVVAVLGAIVTARGTQEPSAADLAVVRTAADLLLDGVPVPEDLAGPIPGVVAERLADPAARDFTMQVAAILCFADVDAAEGDDPTAPDPSRVMVVDDLARYLRVSALSLLELRRMTKEHRDAVAFDVARRMPVVPPGDDGSMVDAALAGSETRLHIDARRVHALWDRIEQLPAGTVGGELVRYYDENGWRYPGTDHHEPLTSAAHDFHHVLGGYATTPAGEVMVGAFAAGVVERPMEAAAALLLWEQLGAGTSAARGAAGAYDAEAFATALDRGIRTSGDYGARGWDPWAIVERDLSEMRSVYQIDDGAQLAPGERYDLDPVVARR